MMKFAEIKAKYPELCDLATKMYRQGLLPQYTHYRDQDKVIGRVVEMLAEREKSKADTHLSDIHRLLEGLKKIDEEYNHSPDLEVVVLKMRKKAAQLRTELIKTYGE